MTAAAVTRNPLPGTLAVPATTHKLGTALANLRGLAGTLTPAGLAFLRDLQTPTMDHPPSRDASPQFGEGQRCPGRC